MTGAASTLGEASSVYTQCSKCETVFRLSAEVLRAAGGQVRCGRCGEVFNALARLAEDSTSFTTGESALDLEVRADSILESVGIPMHWTMATGPSPIPCGTQILRGAPNLHETRILHGTPAARATATARKA